MLVLLEGIGIKPYAYNVLMDKNGDQTFFHVNVQTDTNGLDCSVRELTTVQETESGMKPLNNVFAQKHNIGMEDHAQSGQNVAEEEYGTHKHLNVTA